MADVSRLLTQFATLGDLARLRMLRLLAHDELSVGELSRALQLPQSTVSRHLKLLNEGGWTVKRTEGTASFYRLVETDLDAEALRLWTLARDQLTGPTVEEDDQRLTEVIAARRGDSRAFFGRLGGEWDAMRHQLFGDVFTGPALLGFIEPSWVIADLGCGTGNAAEMLAPFVARIIAIDREPAMIAAARKRLTGVTNVEFREGDLEQLPLDDAEVDAAMGFLVLQHIADPTPVLTEIARTLKPNGVLLIVDMVTHDREGYRHTMGHQHLGFGEKTLNAWGREAGFASVRYTRLRPDTSAKGPGLFAATLRRG